MATQRNALTKKTITGKKFSPGKELARVVGPSSSGPNAPPEAGPFLPASVSIIASAMDKLNPKLSALSDLMLEYVETFPDIELARQILLRKNRREEEEEPSSDNGADIGSVRNTTPSSVDMSEV